MTEADGALSLFKVPRKAGRPRSVNVARELTEALRAAEHLTHADRATIEVGRRLAAEFDATDDLKQVAALAGTLLAYLRELGLSPKSRASLGVAQAAEEVNPLDELALIRRARRESGDDPRP